MAEPAPCALLLLAAGRSSRMGRAKQLLPIGRVPLLQRVVQACLSPSTVPVLVVLGANAAEVRPCLAGLPVTVIVNDDWTEGMGSSIRAGMRALAREAPRAAGVVIALADQPDFSAVHVARLLAARSESGRSIVATRSGGVLMPPAFFAANHFPALAALAGDTGARSLLQSHPDDVAEISAGEVPDLDTPADYAAYLRDHPAG